MDFNQKKVLPLNFPKKNNMTFLGEKSVFEKAFSLQVMGPWHFLKLPQDKSWSL